MSVPLVEDSSMMSWCSGDLWVTFGQSGHLYFSPAVDALLDSYKRHHWPSVSCPDDLKCPRGLDELREKERMSAQRAR